MFLFPSLFLIINIFQFDFTSKLGIKAKIQTIRLKFSLIFQNNISRQIHKLIFIITWPWIWRIPALINNQIFSCQIIRQITQRQSNLFHRAINFNSCRLKSIGRINKNCQLISQPNFLLF